MKVDCLAPMGVSLSAFSMRRDSVVVQVADSDNTARHYILTPAEALALAQILEETALKSRTLPAA